MNVDPKEGELFRQNYLRSPVKLPDSVRARKRFASHFGSSFGENYGEKNKFKDVLAQRLGVDVPYAGYGAYDFDAFWKQSDVGDFLSGITLWCQYFGISPTLIRVARNILAEEDLHYRVDDKGGVHFLVDQEFTVLADATIQSLAEPRLAAAHAALEAGLSYLGPAHQSGKGLIGGVFEAAESAFLVLVSNPKVTLLSGRFLEDKLKPILLARYSTVPDVTDKVDRMITTYSAWVKEAHPYRHGAPFDQVHEAPLELAILSATTGMGFIRFLAGLVVNP